MHIPKRLERSQEHQMIMLFLGAWFRSENKQYGQIKASLGMLRSIDPAIMMESRVITVALLRRVNEGLNITNWNGKWASQKCIYNME
jgi:hypothetical protein